jgi:hypothetical protein
VCNKCQQKSSIVENKRHIVFVDEVETQLREKPIRGSQTQEFHYSEDEARYNIVTLTLTRCSGHYFLGLGFLCLQEGALRTNMPT